MIRATAQAADAFADAPRIERVNALLVGLASVRHDLNMARLDEESERELARLSQARANALVRQMSSLAVAKYVLDRHALPGGRGFGDLRRTGSVEARNGMGEALAAYLSSVNGGEIPYQMLRFKDVQVRRAVAVERATATVADYQGLIKPALDELEAYGKGGVSADAIINLLGYLGISSAILAR